MKENKEPTYAVDTNILVYAFDRTNPHKQEIGKAILEKCWKREKNLVISSQNLAEFFIVVTKKIPSPISVGDAKQIIRDINDFTQWQVCNYNGKTVERAIEIQERTKKHFWDALLAATLIQNGIYHIFTENTSDFKDIEGITACNPFKEKNNSQV